MVGVKMGRKYEKKTRNLVLVPLQGRDRTVGVLCAINKKDGDFDQSDVELLSSISGTVALSIKNARVTEELKIAYQEVKSLNKAKDRAINHLSHELKTPIAIVTGSLELLITKLRALPGFSWESTVSRIKRNLERILEIQYEVDDIMASGDSKAYGLLSLLLDQCADELESLIAEHAGQERLIESVRNRIEDLFGPKEAKPQEIDLGQTLRQRIDFLKPRFAHRRVELITRIDPAPPVFIPPEVLHKVIDGLVKNALENTPDEGQIELTVARQRDEAVLRVHDFGVGITPESQTRIFEGFFSTRDTMAYSTKRPFDFNAGGKGADLLRMKIFAERYNFKIEMQSARCRFIPLETDICPGRISQCRFCKAPADCLASGETTFSVCFPPAPG